MRSITRNTLLICLAFIFTFCVSSNDETNDNPSDSDVSIDDQLSRINLPPGFSISIYADNLDGARSMVMGDNKTLFVGSRGEGKVYAVSDKDGDFKADEIVTIASGLNSPNGVAFKNGSLYVAEISKLWRYDNIESNLSSPADPTLIYDDYPKDRHHGWKYIAFGPDGKLYIPVGAPCNTCESKNEIYASITRMDPDGSNREIFAEGVRNTVGFTWHPDSNEMWFTDNGRDNLGNDLPPCELNRAPSSGLHFGYPYCHGSDIGDPDYGHKFACSEFVAPARKLGPHVAPLGLKFYMADMFPAEYKGHLFIAEHGSWNRSRKIGYRISLVKIDNNQAVSYETFADGWLDEGEQEAFGRPVDVLILDDGSMLISDDKLGVIYRVTYNG